MGKINTTNAPTSFFGGWATVVGTDWAGVNSSGNIVPLTAAGGKYTNDVWSSGANTTVTQNDSITNQTTNSLRFNSPGAGPGGLTVALSGSDVIASGGILITPNVGPNGATITGAGALGAGELIVNQFDASGPLTIPARVVSDEALTKSGPGALIVTGATSNTSFGPWTINGGSVSVSSESVFAGLSQLAINGGTLQVAANTASSFGGFQSIFVGPSIGVGGGTIDVARSVAFLVQSPISNNGDSISSLTKTGPGTLALYGDYGFLAPGFSGGLYLDEGTVVIGSGAEFLSNTIYFNGAASLQFSGYAGSYDSANPTIVIAPGATAVLDDNAGTGGVGGFIVRSPIRGQGALTFISSFGGMGSYSGIDGASYSNWAYSGATTIYAGSAALQEDEQGGEGDVSPQLNPTNVLNLGGTIVLEGNGSQILTMATSVNLIADASSQFFFLQNAGAL